MFRSDAAIIKRVRNGDPLAWRYLVRQYAGRVFNLCYRFVGRSDQAEEITRETFIAIFKRLSTHSQEQENFLTWIVGITRNLIADQYRQARVGRIPVSTDATEDKAPISSSTMLPSHAGPGGAWEREENIALFHKALQQLSPDLREAVILKDLENFSHGEIGAILNIPNITVKSRINRGRVDLAKSLRKHPMRSLDLRAW
ncbi:MAG TPA: RNA polymerase sigma factor [Terriglobia bacterium]|nr:RNA polymerase sigma factor [Terriglobia bacterium]